MARIIHRLIQIQGGGNIGASENLESDSKSVIQLWGNSKRGGEGGERNELGDPVFGCVTYGCLLGVQENILDVSQDSRWEVEAKDIHFRVKCVYLVCKATGLFELDHLQVELYNVLKSGNGIRPALLFLLKIALVIRGLCGSEWVLGLFFSIS